MTPGRIDLAVPIRGELPVIQVSPLMGSSLVVVVFAVVVIGGMGSILGAIVSGLALGK